MSEENPSNIIFETNDIEKAQRVRAALAQKFHSKRYWVCIFNRGRKNGKPQFKLTISNHWDGKLSKDELNSVNEFVKEFKTEEAKQESVAQ